MNVRPPGGDPAVTGDVTVTSHTAAVAQPMGSVCATQGTRVSSATCPVKLGSMAVVVQRGMCKVDTLIGLNISVTAYALLLFLYLLSLVVVSVKTIRSALPLMAPVTHVSPAGTVHNATARARLVIMVMAARRSVHVAGIMNPVIRKLGNVGGVTLDGLAQGLRHTFIIYHNNKSHMFYIISKHCTKYIIKQGFSTVSGGFNYHISCYRVNTLSFGTFSSCVSAFEN